MVKQNLRKLKAELESWEESISIREAAYRAAVVNLKEAEVRFKEAKRVKSRTYAMWKEARTETEKLKSSVKTFNGRVRQWNKNNLNKIEPFNL